MTRPTLRVLILLGIMGMLLTVAATTLLLPVQAAPENDPTPLLQGTPIIATATTREPAPPDAVPPAVPPTPPAGQRPASTATPGLTDPCAPIRATPEQACVLALQAVNGPFTLVPTIYSVNLGDQPTTQPMQLTVRSSGGLDLLVTAQLAGQAVTLGSGDAATPLFLPAGLVGWVVLRVENRSPQPDPTARYTLELRTGGVATPAADASSPTPTATVVDLFAQALTFEAAAPIAINTSYDVVATCPPGDACPGGRHTHLRVLVKQGVTYLLATFDLTPGVDTVLELFQRDPHGPDGYTQLAVNDDYRPGHGPLSALTWTASTDSEVLVRIAPRMGGVVPIIPNVGRQAPAQTFRFAIAERASDMGRQLQQTIDDQTGGPATPTPAPALPARPPAAADPPPARAQPAPAGGAGASGGDTAPPPDGSRASGAARQEYSEDESAPASAPERTKTQPGPARVDVPTTTLRVRPDPRSERLRILPVDTVVTMTGVAAGGWVEVDLPDSALPGWVRARDLRRVLDVPNGGTPPVATPARGAVAPPDTTGTTAATAGQARITTLPPAPPPVSPPVAAPMAVPVVVRVVQGDVTERISAATAATMPPVVGMRVQLVTALDALLGEALTDAQGQVRMPIQVAAGAGVYVRVPGPGLRLAVDLQAPDVTIVLPTPQGGPR